jgi:hypothetical protein
MHLLFVELAEAPPFLIVIILVFFVSIRDKTVEIIGEENGTAPWGIRQDGEQQCLHDF